MCHYCTVPAAAAADDDDDAMLMQIYTTRSFNKPCNGACEPNEYIYDATAQRIRTIAIWAAIVSLCQFQPRCTTVPYRTTIVYTSCDICHHDISISTSPPRDPPHSHERAISSTPPCCYRYIPCANDAVLSASPDASHANA